MRRTASRRCSRVVGAKGGGEAPLKANGMPTPTPTAVINRHTKQVTTQGLSRTSSTAVNNKKTTQTAVKLLLPQTGRRTQQIQFLLFGVNNVVYLNVF